ncbi:hypothetical protein VKT23_017394 [Stygiomarasmius scandens]|uniref:DAZ-associated protein 2 n=1 Tax=Marasmiellus scandens TaxID=2682957 RepID=A0ABR1IS56_9AGAR
MSAAVSPEQSRGPTLPHTLPEQSHCGYRMLPQVQYLTAPGGYYDLPRPESANVTSPALGGSQIYVTTAASGSQQPPVYLPVQYLQLPASGFQLQAQPYAVLIYPQGPPLLPNQQQNTLNEPSNNGDRE